MKKATLTLVLVIALSGLGCLGPQTVAETKDKLPAPPPPMEEFTAQKPVEPPAVTPSDVTAANAREICKRLQSEIDREQTTQE